MKLFGEADFGKIYSQGQSIEQSSKKKTNRQHNDSVIMITPVVSITFLEKCIDGLLLEQ